MKQLIFESMVKFLYFIQFFIEVLGAGCGHWEDINSWTVELPEVEKPPVEVPAPPPAGSPTKRILQLTDIHLDLRYAKVDTTSGGASSPSSWFSNHEDPPAHRHPS